jgi:hypothetical protein
MTPLELSREREGCWKTAIAPWPGLVTSSPSMTVSSSGRSVGV